MSEMDEMFEELQEQASDRPPITPEQLPEIIEAHRKWVESEGKEGERADLFEANLQEATLVGAKGLTASQVKKAKNWKLAFYSDDFLKKLGLPPDHNERVKEKLAEMEKKATGAKP